jgi:UDP-N-acetylmuramoyl-L-alanyl-D-glutamate--2,6-diaminopimelate ligase
MNTAAATLSLATLIPGARSLSQVFLRDLVLQTDAIQPGGGVAFVALPGTKRHGLDFAAKALAMGAEAVLWDEAEPDQVPDDDRLFHVPGLRARLPDLAGQLYGRWPAERPMIAVTGTDGKTSVTHQLSQCLGYLGQSCAVIGTLGIGSVDELTPSRHTTPDLVGLYKALGQLARSGFSAVAMEASSHALDQNRMQGLRPHVAVLTQLGRDHLDYHHTPEAYAEAKARLFTMPGLRAVVLNRDDALGRRLITRMQTDFPEVECWTYGSPDPRWAQARDLAATDAVASQSGLSFTLTVAGQRYPVSVPLWGEFQIANLQAVFASLLALGYHTADAAAALASIRGIPGRMEAFSAPDAPTLVVDYAHTPRALESALRALRAHAPGRLFCVFGCGGDRDAGKRPEMGKVAAAWADRVIVTDDNPRSESPEEIRRQILAGCRLSGSNSRDIGDRALAIETAYAEGVADDVILIAGKGHETQQIFADQTIPFSDRELAATLQQRSQRLEFGA